MSIPIHPAEARRRFAEFASNEIGRADLARGALLIALEEYATLDVETYLEKLEAIAELVRARCVKGEPSIFSLGHLQTVLFDELHFAGDESHYYDVRNSFLNEVIDHRLGLPITLSIVVMDVGERVGVDIAGVGLPGHFIVKARFELSEVFLDPFHGGRTLTTREIDLLLREQSRGQIVLRSEFLRAWQPREVLIRVLTNLHASYARANDTKRAVSAKERISLLRERT
jgi:regulator of sirC expression with transglutaminase-like and TPR domain